MRKLLFTCHLPDFLLFARHQYQSTFCRVQLTFLFFLNAFFITHKVSTAHQYFHFISTDIIDCTLQTPIMWLYHKNMLDRINISHFLVRLRSKWNTSSLHYVERRMHRHGFGWRWWVENKAFFEHILISNIHGLALFFYDWTTERLFVCIMKHIEGHVPESTLVCVQLCT